LPSANAISLIDMRIALDKDVLAIIMRCGFLASGKF